MTANEERLLKELVAVLKSYDSCIDSEYSQRIYTYKDCRPALKLITELTGVSAMRYILGNNWRNPYKIILEEISKSSSECSMCGTAEEVEYSVNPYEQDINGREEWQYLCPECYLKLSEEI